MFVPVRRYFLFSEPADYFFFSGYVPTGRLVSVKKFSENIMNFAHRRILIHIYFLYYYSAFLVYFFIVENRVEIEVGNQLENLRQFFFLRLGPISRVFLACESVILRAQRVKFFGDGSGARSFRGSFEHQMFKKMGTPVYFFCFVFRAGFNQNQSRRRESFPRRQNKP